MQGSPYCPVILKSRHVHYVIALWRPCFHTGTMRKTARVNFDGNLPSGKEEAAEGLVQQSPVLSVCMILLSSGANRHNTSSVQVREKLGPSHSLLSSTVASFCLSESLSVGTPHSCSTFQVLEVTLGFQMPSLLDAFVCLCLPVCVCLCVCACLCERSNEKIGGKRSAYINLVLTPHAATHCKFSAFTSFPPSEYLFLSFHRLPPPFLLQLPLPSPSSPYDALQGQDVA